MEYLIGNFWIFRVRRGASSFWVMIQSLPPYGTDHVLQRPLVVRAVMGKSAVWCTCGRSLSSQSSWHAADMQLTTNQRFTLQRDLFFQSFLLSVFCPFKTSSHGFCSAHALTALLNKGDLWPLTRWSRRSRRSIRELCGEWNRNVRHVRLEMQQPRAEWWISETNDLCDPDVNFMNFES